jgi:hypothetical protein
VKWDLYRLKCDQIEEKYAAFKKMQMKKKWWFQFLVRRRSYLKAMSDFSQRREELIAERKRQSSVIYA